MCTLRRFALSPNSDQLQIVSEHRRIIKEQLFKGGMPVYTALYRAQRPEIFSEVIGQDHIVRILKNQIATDSVSHAYLFCGTRGTGKTTTARILAKAVNCLDDEDRPCGHCANCIAIKESTFMDVVDRRGIQQRRGQYQGTEGKCQIPPCCGQKESIYHR